jgi:biotin transport system ATP-binding protein
MSVEVSGLRVEAEDGGARAVLLDGVSCTLSRHTTAVIGENGSGKSTLARAVGGLTRPAAGSIRVDGLDTVRQARQLRRRVGFLFANPAAQIIMPTVREDVAMTLRGRGLSAAEVAERVDRALAEHRLTELADRPCLSLSSGQQQRLAMCAVLVGEPGLVIADEPTSLLDARHRRAVAERLLSAEGPDVLLVTHDLDLAARCDEALLIDGGRLVRQGPPAAVIGAYEELLLA